MEHGVAEYSRVEYGIEFEATEGLLGFEDVKHYTFAKLAGGGPFRWLQATRGVKLAFIVAPPIIFWPSYSITAAAAGDAVLSSLGAASVNDLTPFIIVTVPDDPLLATGNFAAPVLVNPGTRKLRQVILRDVEYPISHPLFPEGARALLGEAGRTSGVPGRAGRMGEPQGRVSRAGEAHGEAAQPGGATTGGEPGC